MPSWSPFSKPISELTEDDLSELEGKTEAWWLEYKQDISAGDLAKAVAAFANAHGGWLLVGIEAAKETNEPVLPPCGVDSESHTIESLRQSVTSRLSHVPDFQIRRMELGNGRLVFALAVDEGVEPPYIRMSDGRIYVRRGEVSEPIDYIKDRAQLDALYAKRGAHARGLEDRLRVRGHGEYIVEYHQSIRAGDGLPQDGHCSVCLVIVPLGAARARFELPEPREGNPGWRLLQTVTDRILRPFRGWHEWQHGTFCGPARLWSRESATAVSGVGKDGVLELSLVMSWSDTQHAPQRFDRSLPEFLAVAVRYYWVEQYVGRLSLTMHASGSPARPTDVVRQVTIPPPPVDPERMTREESQGFSMWLYSQTQDLLSELARWAKTEQVIRGDS